MEFPIQKTSTTHRSDFQLLPLEMADSNSAAFHFLSGAPGMYRRRQFDRVYMGFSILNLSTAHFQYIATAPTLEQSTSFYGILPY